MPTIQYLPALPNVIELDLEALCPEEDTLEVGGYEEFQMKAEMQAVRQRQKIKMNRHRVELY